MSTFEVPELNVTSSLTTGSIDYTSGVALNVATKTTSTLPLNPVTGQLVFNTDDNRPRLWTGSAWKVLGLRESVGVYTDATRPSGVLTNIVITLSTNYFLMIFIFFYFFILKNMLTLPIF